jgi:hypothetical protein
MNPAHALPGSLPSPRLTTPVRFPPRAPALWISHTWLVLSAADVRFDPITDGDNTGKLTHFHRLRHALVAVRQVSI